ncbi:hypothetical protein TSMEX_003519 [Taenia solium]|eukprot:TsM_001189700 transcript=TsM_001189700 gene=TsM_001189700
MPSTDPGTALVYERFLAFPYKPTTEEVNPSSKAARWIWRQWCKQSLEDEVLWYEEDTTFLKRLVFPGSLTQAVLQELHEQLGHVGEEKIVEASSKRYWWWWMLVGEMISVRYHSQFQAYFKLDHLVGQSTCLNERSTLLDYFSVCVWSCNNGCLMPPVGFQFLDNFSFNNAISVPAYSGLFPDHRVNSRKRRRVT